MYYVCIFNDINILVQHQVAATPAPSPGNELHVDSDLRHSVKDTGDSAELRVSAGDDETAGVTTCKLTSLSETGSYIRI